MNTSVVLAAGTGASWFFTIVGVLIVIALLVLLWTSRRRLARRPDPPQTRQPRAGSWKRPGDDDPV
ncbi:DUF6479 family protein [Streptomyces sp. NPDC059524]|uniref:DUF6479 family protein n=1 Tax=Streptomyces sp. NPDC059524 TaxID=3346856 RepID=UPI003674EED1